MFSALLLPRLGFRMLASASGATIRNFAVASRNLAVDSRNFAVITNSDEPGPYRIALNVSMFDPSEIKVKTGHVTLVSVEAKHQKEDEQGFLSNHISMEYVVPFTHNGDKLEARLSSGVLVLIAPKLNGDIYAEMKDIPIQK